jgi:tetratricopeptide (TPR) repeat protein
MKPAAIVVVALALASFAGAQQPSGGQNQKPAQPGAAAAPAAKHMPQAKTQPEFEAYKAAVANQNDPVVLEKATDDFAAKFPTSELTPLLYRATMRGYQNANNGDKLAEVAQKVLKSDPDDPEALTDVAEVIAERTHDTDLDKDQRYEEARKDAQHALQTIDTNLPPGVAPEQAEAYKGLLKSTAYSVVGTVDFNQEKFADAESNFRKSVDAFPSQPDPVVVLRLALALDKQDKYPEALKEANHAVDLTQENTSPGRLARQERDRLVQLTGGTANTGAKPPASTPPASTPPASNPQPH